MKTAVSIPDEVYRSAEKLASKLRVSRSRLYAEALRTFLREHDGQAVTERLRKVCEKVDTSPDEFMRAAARQTLRRSEW